MCKLLLTSYEQVACLNGHAHIAQELMDLEQIKYMHGSIEWEVCFGVLLGIRDRDAVQNPMDILQPLLNQGILDLVADGAENNVIGIYWVTFIICISSYDPDLFNICRAALCEPWLRMSPLSRCFMLFGPNGILYSAYSAKIVPALLCSSGRITADDVQEWTRHGTSLVHLMFYYFGYSYAGKWPSSDRVSNMEALRALIRDTYSVCDDLHLTTRLPLWTGCKGPVSPLLSFLLGATTTEPRRSYGPHAAHPRPRRVRAALQAFLAEFQNCGVDLLVYGRREAERLAADSVASYHRTNSSTITLDRRIWHSKHQRLYPMAIHYGPTTTDWNLDLEYHYSNEELAGDFWTMVENHPSPQIVPGAWPDEERDDVGNRR